MHKRHAEILESLRRGGFISCEISGFYYKQRRLRDAAEDALLGSGQLVLVRVKSKYFGHLDYLVHRDYLEGFKTRLLTSKPSREVLEVIEPFRWPSGNETKGMQGGKEN